MNETATDFRNGNGNGNGHSKIFDLAPKQDPLLSQVVPAARRKVCQNTNICEAARMFYCFLTDMSLLQGVNSRKGVVKFSDHDLAVRFKRNEKTIRNWKRAVESTGEVWTTEKWMKNSFPQTVYNITAIVGQATLPMNVDSEDGSLVEDEVFSSNRRRLQVSKRDGSSGKFACRAHGVSGCPLCQRKTPPGVPYTVAAAITPEKTQENAPSGKILPPTTAIDCRPPRQLVAAHRGNSLPSPTAIDCRPARQLVAVAHGNTLPPSAAIDCRSERQTVADNEETGDVSKRVTEAPFKRSTGLNARKSAGGAKKFNSENLFLLDVGAMMESWKPGSSKGELSGSGAWWRMSYRQSPDLMRRVLAEVGAMIKEGKIKFNPGSTAVDLFKRWGGLDGQRKQKAAAGSAART